MRNCKYCQLEFDDSIFKGHASNCRANPNYEERIRKSSLKKPRVEIILTCEHKNCGKKFIVITTNKTKRRFCSRSCANSHYCSPEQRLIVSQKLRKRILDHHSDEQFVNFVANAQSWRDLSRLAHLPSDGGVMNYLHQRTISLKLDTSHFWKPKSIEEILSIRPNESKGYLKSALIKFGRDYCCVECGLLPLWNEKKLVLQVDHINGIPYDHRPENLRFLCPNCHSQTPTFAWKNVKKKKHTV
jgi:hypothetical protein